MTLVPTKDKFYNICFVDEHQKGTYVGVAQCVSAEDCGLYDFILPNGEVACFCLQDVVSESEIEFVAASKQAFQDLLSSNTKLNLEVKKKEEQIEQLLALCLTLKEKISNPSLDVKKRMSELTQK